MDKPVLVRVPEWLRDELKVESVRRKKEIGELIIDACVAFYESVQQAQPKEKESEA